jgi:hypothetical protein
MPKIDLSMLNQRQTPAFYADVLANRPAAGFIGRIFVSTNTYAFYRDNGTGWDLIGGPGTGTITGSGATGQIALWDGASTITGDTGLTYNGTDNSLTASKFIVTGGTSSQFLKGDGSLDSNTYNTGSGAASQVAFFSGTNAISGENELWWDSVNNRLGINTNTPGASLDVHNAASSIAQFNQTTATNNTLLVLQNSGNALWRLGNYYNAGANDFNIFNVNTNSNSVSFNRITNAATFAGLITNNILLSTIIASASCDVSNSYTPTTTITDVNSYGLISRYKLNLTNGVYNSTGSTNATAIYGFVNIDGNNGTISTQSIRAITAGLAIATSAIKLSDYRNYQVNTPEALIAGSTITNVYGLYINNQKGATNITITNGWGIYQNGLSDNNYLNGSLFVGSNVNNGYKFEVTGTANITSQLTVERIQINSTTFQPFNINSTYGQVGLNFGNSGSYFGGVGSANNFTSNPGVNGNDMGIGTNGSATGKIALCTGAGYLLRFLVKANGILNATNVPTYATNADALAGGLVAGDFYRTAIGQLQIVF